MNLNYTARLKDVLYCDYRLSYKESREAIRKGLVKVNGKVINLANFGVHDGSSICVTFFDWSEKYQEFYESDSYHWWYQKYYIKTQ